jgi:ribosome maturation factor RimP
MAMSTIERVQSLVEPVVTGLDLELVDIEHAGGILRITIDRPGGDRPASVDREDGLDLDVISQVTRAVSRLLDEHDPLPGRYTLEVSSPGLERRLRTPDHFVRAVGSEVTVKTTTEVDGHRRFKGTLIAADESGVTVRSADDGIEHVLAHHQIEKARTVFEWGPTPKPGGARNQRKKASAR